MVSLRTYQEELKKILFFRDPEAEKSILWPDQIPDRLWVYRNNTRTNWSNTLDHDFELTRKQFAEDEWETLKKKFFIKHPPQHWELNASMAPFVKFLNGQKIKPFIKELADYEWHDLKVFIDRTVVKKGSIVTNPTVFIRAYQHQIFFWVDAEAEPTKPPIQKPEVLVFFRDSKNTRHIQEADPLMILMLEHFKKPGAVLNDLEPIRQKLLPANQIPLQIVLATLKKQELIL